MNVLVEAVACTADDAIRAESAGADRIELVSAISEGGLTPSIGAVQEAKVACQIPIVAMVRPRGGGFTYTENEFRTILRDVRWLARAGADGIVFGALTTEGTVDSERLQQVVEAAEGKPVVFHRAFDFVADAEQGLDALIACGVVRVLTSGHAANALTGAHRLRHFVRYSKKQIEILAGGGVRARNAAQIVFTSGVRQVHLGPFGKKKDEWTEKVAGRQMSEHLELRSEEIRAVVQELRGI